MHFLHNLNHSHSEFVLLRKSLTMKKINAIAIHEILTELEFFAPLTYQESYDNSGLLVGDRHKKIDKALLTLDCTEVIVDEAIRTKAGLIIAHHPILFSGLKSLTGKSYIERTLLKAIKNDIAIYASHTNLDNVHQGVNYKIGQKLGLESMQVLSPMSGTLYQLYVYVPQDALEKVRDSVFKAGAGQIGNYHDCSFTQEGIGTFMPMQHAKPYQGSIFKLEKAKEIKLEVLVPKHKLQMVLHAMKTAHPYEEVAYGYIPLQNPNQELGSGMIGEFKKPKTELDFLKWIKKQLNVKTIRHTALLGKMVQRVAFCGGSGSFLLQNAISKGADAFITSDFKYHQFFDTENKLLLADIGHFESEQFTPEIFYDVLSKKFPNFAFHLSSVNTNPIHYF